MNPEDLSAGPALRPRPAQHAHRWAALVVLCASALIINVDNTILNVALPTLVRKLHATSSELEWVVDSYALVFAGLLLVGPQLGRPIRAPALLSDRPDGLRGGIDRRRVLRFGGPADRLASRDGRPARR